MFKKVPPNKRLFGSSGVSYSVIARKRNGKVYSYVECPAKEVFPDLPPPSRFTLQAQQEAGVQLKQVPCDLICAQIDSSTRINENYQFPKPPENE